MAIQDGVFEWDTAQSECVLQVDRQNDKRSAHGLSGLEGRLLRRSAPIGIVASSYATRNAIVLDRILHMHSCYLTMSWAVDSLPKPLEFSDGPHMRFLCRASLGNLHRRGNGSDKCVFYKTSLFVLSINAIYF